MKGAPILTQGRPGGWHEGLAPSTSSCITFRRPATYEMNSQAPDIVTDGFFRALHRRGKGVEIAYLALPRLPARARASPPPAKARPSVGIDALPDPRSPT